MDLITQSLKRAAGGGAQPTNINYFAGSYLTDNLNGDLTLFPYFRNQSLSVPPYTSTNTRKYVTTTDFTNYTEFTPAFVPTDWGNGTYTTPIETFLSSEPTALSVGGSIAINPNRSILVSYDGGNSKPKYSTDQGTTWTDSNITLPGYFSFGMFYADGRFYIAYANNQGTWSSADGITWINDAGHLLGSQSYSFKAGAPNYYIVGSSSASNMFALARTAATGTTNFILQGAFTAPYGSANFVSKVVNQVQTNDGVMILADRVYSVTWNGTNPVATQVYTVASGRVINAITWDEINNRYLALFVDVADWRLNNELRASTDNGATWNLVTSVPSQFSNRYFIIALANGKIVVSGNGSGCGIYDPATNTWSESLNYVFRSSTLLTTTKYIINYFENNVSKTSIINTTSASQTEPIYEEKVWYSWTPTGQSSGNTITYSWSNTALATAVTANVQFTGTRDYFLPGGTYPSYISTSTTADSFFVSGPNYKNIQLLSYLNTKSFGITNYPMATSNMWRSTDYGNNFSKVYDFTYKVTNKADGVSPVLPQWPTFGTSPVDGKVGFSRSICDSQINTSMMYFKTTSVEMAGLNDIQFVGGEWWAWGHNGSLAKSTNGTTWTAIPVRDRCMGSRITAFCKNGNTVMFFTNLAQQFVSSDNGVTWTDNTTAFSPITGKPVPTNYSAGLTGAVMECIWTGTNYIAVTFNRILTSTNGTTWTAITPSSGYTPTSIAKHPSQDVIVIGCTSGRAIVTTSSVASQTPLTFSTYGVSGDISKVLFNGSNWFMFIGANANGKYLYTPTANPNTLASWRNPSNATDFPSTRNVGTGSVHNATWDGTYLWAIDHVNRNLYRSTNGDNWTNLSGQFDTFINAFYYKFSKHPWAIASSGTRLIMVGDMCDAVTTTTIDGSNGWADFTTIKTALGVVDPSISFGGSSDGYVTGVTITNGGSGYGVNGTNIANTATYTISNPADTNGVKPKISSMQVGANGAIVSISVSNGNEVRGYGGDSWTGLPIAPTISITGPGTGATATFQVSFKPIDIKLTGAGENLGPVASHGNFTVSSTDTGLGEVYFTNGRFASSTPQTPSGLKLNLGERNTSFFNNAVYVYAAPTFYASDSGDKIIFKPSNQMFSGLSMNANYLNDNTMGSSAISTNKVVYRCATNKGENWNHYLFQKTEKSILNNSDRTLLYKNVGFPIHIYGSDRVVYSSNISVRQGFFSYTDYPVLLNTAIGAESDGTKITFKYYMYKSLLDFNSRPYPDDNNTNMLANLPSSMSLVLTKDSADYNNFMSNIFYVLNSDQILISHNGANERTRGDTLVVYLTPIELRSNQFVNSPSDTSKQFWFRSTDGGSTWTDISANIRTMLNGLTDLTTQQKVSVSPKQLRWSQNDQLWYSAGFGLYHFTTPDLTNWTVVRDPAGVFPDYPD